jgi:hypothetical protein
MVDGRPWQLIKSTEQIDPIQGQFEVTLPKKTTEIALIAKNEYGTSPPEIAKLHWNGKTLTKNKPNLYVLGISVNDYIDENLETLSFANNDVMNLTTKISELNKYYGEVNVKHLPNATSAKITENFAWLQQTAKPNDVIMLFFVGYAMQKEHDNNYNFLPADTDLINNLLSAENFIKSFGSIKSKVILFLDTITYIQPESKQLQFASIDSFINQVSSPENGVIVFSSTMGTQQSEQQDNQSIFTTALLEALDGKSDNNKDGKLMLQELGNYIFHRVSELSNGKQTPIMVIPKTIDNFLINKL